MKLSVVILNYNVSHFLELCLKSVNVAIKNLEAEIIVVDNNSTDDSCKMVSSLFPKVKLIENEGNFGFSKGNNIGVAQARGEYICILNPDTVVAEDTFETLLTFADFQENLGIIGCRLIDGAGRFLPESKRNLPLPKVSIKKILGNSKSYYAMHLGQKDIGKVDILVGAFMLMKREIYNKLSGFDEDYFMYGEDVDLSFRVQKAGYNNLYHGGETIIHFKGESTLKDMAYAKRFYQAMQIFYKKHFKRNFLFDISVWLGSRILPFFKKDTSKNNRPPKQFVIVAEKKNEALNKFNSVKQICTINHFEKETEYIFDNNSVPFKKIIQEIDSFPENVHSSFKILPKNSNFIIGSNSSKTRGNVWFLGKN